MSLFSEVYCVRSMDSVVQMRRPYVDFRGEEVLLAAVLCPLFSTDISVVLLPRLFAADSSDVKGASA